MTLESRLPEIAAKLEPETRRAIRVAGELVAATARPLVIIDPDRDEFPAIHIHVDEEPEGLYVVAEEWYALLVEHGTRYTAARPFMVPAFEANRKAIVKTVAAGVRNAT